MLVKGATGDMTWPFSWWSLNMNQRRRKDLFWSHKIIITDMWQRLMIFNTMVVKTNIFLWHTLCLIRCTQGLVVVSFGLVTVCCHYNMVSSQPNPHKIHPRARPLGWGMGCILWLKPWFILCLCHCNDVCNINYAELVMGNDHGFWDITYWLWQQESCLIR